MLEAKLGFSPLREVVAGSYSPHFPVNQVSGELCRDPDIRARLEQLPRSRGGSRDSALSRGSPVELHPHPTQHQKAASSASCAWPLLKEGAGTDILHSLEVPKCLATAVPCGRCSRALSRALGSAVTGTALCTGSLGTVPWGQGAETRPQEVPEHSRRCQLLALLPSTCLAKPQAGAGHRNLLHVKSRRAGMQAGSCSPSDTSITPFRCWFHTGMC